MADAPPEKMQALVADGKGGAAVQTVPVPKLEEGQILVKVDYVALVSVMRAGLCVADPLRAPAGIAGMACPPLRG